MTSIGDPDGRQFTGAVQLGQHQGVSTIGLHWVSSLHRDQLRRHDDAVMPTAGQQAVQPVSAGASLVAEADPAVLIIAQPSRQLTQNLGPVLKNAELADLAASAALGNR